MELQFIFVTILGLGLLNVSLCRGQNEDVELELEPVEENTTPVDETTTLTTKRIVLTHAQEKEVKIEGLTPGPKQQPPSFDGSIYYLQTYDSITGRCFRKDFNLVTRQNLVTECSMSASSDIAIFLMLIFGVQIVGIIAFLVMSKRGKLPLCLTKAIQKRLTKSQTAHAQRQLLQSMVPDQTGQVQGTEAMVQGQMEQPQPLQSTAQSQIGLPQQLQPMTQGQPPQSMVQGQIGQAQLPQPMAQGYLSQV